MLADDDPSSEGGQRRQLVNIETGANGPIVQTFQRKVQAFAFSQDGRFAPAATGISPNENHSIAAPSELVIWDAKTGRELLRVADKEIVQNYAKLAFIADGWFLVVQAESPYQGLTIWGHPPIAEPKATETVEMPGKAEAKESKELPSPARFQSLFRDLAAESTSDARRVEAVFLATLGRFPTDVEARTLASQLAKRSDKAAALKDLLDTLVETAEFKVHAEELGRLAK
jgi:hypothetical protein